MKKFFKILIAVLTSKTIRKVVVAAIKMTREVVAEIKKAKEDGTVTDDEKKSIAKVAWTEFKKVIDEVIAGL